MKAVRQIERLEKICKMISEENTGPSKEFAVQLGISPRHLYKILDYVRDFGVDVNYSKLRRTFFFSSHKVLIVEFDMKLLDKNELERINGGNYFLSSYYYLNSTIFFKVLC